MLSFSDWFEMTGERMDLDEAIARRGWVKIAAGALTARAHAQRSRVKTTSGTDAKIDALADLMLTTVHLQTLSIATDLNDRSILRKGKK
tara:strand:+ start:11 stop:277 length:267 start_codon:yes stop_codon:yes gene_type:complete